MQKRLAELKVRAELLLSPVQLPIPLLCDWPMLASMAALALDQSAEIMIAEQLQCQAGVYASSDAAE